MYTRPVLCFVPPKGRALLLHPTGLLFAGGEFSYVVSRPDDIDLK